jgi:hypothetical protein
MDINELNKLAQNAAAAMQAVQATLAVQNAGFDAVIQQAQGKDKAKAMKAKAKANLLINKAKKGEDVQASFKEMVDEYRDNK